jgi:hypothetical protein
MGITFHKSFTLPNQINITTYQVDWSKAAGVRFGTESHQYIPTTEITIAFQPSASAEYNKVIKLTILVQNVSILHMSICLRLLKSSQEMLQ